MIEGTWWHPTSVRMTVSIIIPLPFAVPYQTGISTPLQIMLLILDIQGCFQKQKENILLPQDHYK